MIQTNFTNIREIQRNYKKISKQVNETDAPLVVLSKNQPQFAIVSLKALSHLQKTSPKRETWSLMHLIEWAEKTNTDPQTDLSKNHDKHAWGK